jgi:hypothetical protein
MIRYIETIRESGGTPLVMLSRGPIELRLSWENGA